MIVTDRIEEYFLLMEQKPQLFLPSSVYPIVTDQSMMEAFERESGKQLGVLYKSPYNTLVVDLINGKQGLYTYERIIPTASGRGVVCIPVIQEKLLLLDQYRHPIRGRQLCFPRGFGENGVSAEENAKKELAEEIGAEVDACVFLGSITADSGVIGAACDVFLCRISTYGGVSAEEGIGNVLLLDEKTLEEKIAAREITDSFTLSAYSLFKFR